ncbi:MAG: DUF192 domain-containing protein [Candidatus Aminicenantes bacterium]|nr:DUF192 domain-containing protein [Candidatus Aminicenantes bacterium]
MKKAALALILAALLGSCAFAERRPRFIKVFLPDGAAITSELAVTDAERARGLMFRETIGPDQGMLFVFPEEGVHSFWMKNTKIALDMLWLDRDRRVIHIEADVPPCLEDPCPSYGPGRPALFVLELKAGSARAHGIRLADRIEFVLPDLAVR